MRRRATGRGGRRGGGFRPVAAGGEPPPPQPTVSAISPAYGATEGGTAVTITGTNFTGATAATVGGVALTGLVVVNSTTITGTTGAHAAQDDLDVVVTAPTASGTLAGGFDYLAAPTVTSISPAFGKTAGGNAVTITGTGFTRGAGATGATIGGVAITSFTVVNDTTITGMTDAHVAQDDVAVVVTHGLGNATLSAAFDYLAPPTVSGISPAAGPHSGGTAVTVTGTGFLRGAGATGVTVGGVALTGAVVVNDTTITGTTGAHAVEDDVAVVVTHGLGNATLSAAFDYAFTPAALSGLVWWLRGDDVVLVGSKVSQMNDRSGSGDANRHAAQATDAARPTYIAADAVFNNQPTLSGWAAAGIRLFTGTWNTTYATPLTMFHVGQAPSVNGYYYSKANQSPRLDATAFGTQGRLLGSVIYSQSVPSFTRNAMCGVWNGASSKIFLNAKTAAGVGDSGASSLGPGGMVVGTWTAGGATFGVTKLAEIIAYNRVLSDAEIGQVMDYLGSRYAISIAA